MELKALPQNNEAEKQVLGSILKHNEAIYEVVDILKPDDFYGSRHVLIYSTMLLMSSNNTPIDMVTVANILGADKVQAIGGVSYLAELYSEVISTQTIRKYAEIVRDKAERRKVIKTCQDALEKAYNDEQVVKSIIGSLEDELLNVGFENENKILTDEELMSKTLTMIQDNYERGGDITGISTGLSSLDQATNGIVKGDFIVIAGRPSMGKTCFALNIANNIAKTNKLALFELEMSAEKIGARRLAAQALINATRLPRGKIDPQEWERVAAKSAEIAYRNNMFTDTTAGITMTEIKAKCKKLKLKYGLDVVIIDHLTLITPTNTKESRVNQVGEITRQAKILAKDLDVSVIMLSQLSRAVEQRTDKIPIMSDLRESGTIEQDADLIILLFRDEYYHPDTDKKGIIEAIIAKQRDGRTGTIQFSYKPEYQLITDKPRL